MRELLRELGAMGKTILVSSHILAELAELCDSLGIIEGGRLVASGPLDRITRLAREGRTIQIKLLSDRDAAQALLASQPGVGQIFLANGNLEIDFVGDDQATAALLSTLVGAGHQVLGFAETSSGLEEVFLRLTQGSAEE
jgi:ABC-2 type transport system ATP-binding protein